MGDWGIGFISRRGAERQRAQRGIGELRLRTRNNRVPIVVGSWFDRVGRVERVEME